MKKTLVFASIIAGTFAFSAIANTNTMKEELNASMTKMHDDMHKSMMTDNADQAFAEGMLAHHIGAVEMAQIELKYGKDPEMRQLAENIIKAQDAEIKQMQEWIRKNKK
ncbi:CopM family metallochaperone [Xenorhabdus doucetiae]|uniref:Putative exported protein n=1 Tax=Xenorhabdus doucetiae TaxID=351671 RepID=A0A068QPL9_9GAMM|nr:MULTISPECIES: DUF305 domain-containing protein [Xenorhabdus]MBD2783097.1 DUF305 domain-containing protein [Xenorhabdus sp. 3]MBD2788735.1 DUF305 domain-containing protein [Xenorhabdus sp. DI]TYP01944.1 protein of unknown function (DUF305) [Xenorhabdus doucetiae]CDG15730.1 putative exported protein [Xenorhabdus doucetiae]